MKATKGTNISISAYSANVAKCKECWKFYKHTPQPKNKSVADVAIVAPFIRR